MCDHPNVVKLADYFEDPMNIYLVMEFLEGTSLLKYVVKQEYLKEPNCKRIMKEIFQGLAYLHELGIVHRDIKLDNIMMAVNPTDPTNDDVAIPKLIDFGLATICAATDKRTEAFGTIAYCSPEIINKRPYN